MFRPPPQFLHRPLSCREVVTPLWYIQSTVAMICDLTVFVSRFFMYYFIFSFQTVKQLSPGLRVFSQSELLMEFHRLLPFGFLEGLTLFSTAYETQMRKKEAEKTKIDPQDSTWSGSSVKVTGPK